MVGLVLATHGRLAEELLRAAEGIVGTMERSRAVSISAASSMEAARAELGEAIRAVDEGERSAPRHVRAPMQKIGAVWRP